MAGSPVFSINFTNRLIPAKPKTSAGNTLNFIRGNENVTHSAQGETVFWAEIFCLEYPSTRSEKGNVHFANYRFSFRKLQISILQTTDFHCVLSHFVSFHFVSSHFVSQTTVSLINRIQRNDSTESVNLTCQSARTVRLFCSNQFCPLCINTVLAIILLVTSNVVTLSFTQHQRLRALIFLMFPPQKNLIFFMEHTFVDLSFPY